ncbi:MAG: tetratricopeptide repeat-containing glycosyltransferase family protein [Cytophagales bacterium]|nr:tetratricopeptide repeat-containing glycosyltransferase family protein [Cytophagales bacterium]
MLLTEANTLAQSGKPAQAIELYDQYLGQEPNNAAAWNNRGNSLDDMGCKDEALASFDQALAINPHYPQALCNKGVVLHSLHRNQEALAYLNQCLALDPNLALAYSNRGNVFRALHQYDLALADYVRATELDPLLVDAHWNESTCRLHMGDYDLGWKKHEWRWKTPALLNQTANTPHTTWQLGDPIHNQSFVIWPEGGFGDAIQFTRFAHQLRHLSARVSIAAPKPLYRLYQQSFEDFELIPMIDGMALPNADYHCSIMSLPMVCGITSLDKLPPAPPYIKADTNEVKRWKNRLKKAMPSTIRIGLTWAGNPQTGADLERSLHLRHFSHLKNACRKNAQFVSLQKGASAAQIGELAEEQWAGPELLDLTAELNDWADTAALIANLDLVISCDTGVAHLAAAMGKPTWILSRYDGCWRWLIDRTDSPWYPSVRLFRQPRFGDWDSVIQAVTSALAAP